MREILVYPSRQELTLTDDESTQLTFPISTALNGLGEEEGSYKTPRGKHRIAAKIGARQPFGSVFKGREPTGEIWKPETTSEHDLILTRILWLEGLEPINSNTYQRYIYLHGTNHENSIGSPVSMGCIRLLNQDILTLFDLVEVGTTVTIFDGLR
ncbi:MAG: L,D-transpeptidase [Verrucomicrobiota bacterium]